MSYNKEMSILIHAVLPVREMKRTHIFKRDDEIQARLYFDQAKNDYIIECCGQVFESGLSSYAVLEWLINNRFINARTGDYTLEVQE